MIKHSTAISNIMKNRPDCFKQFKQLAVFSVGGHFHKVEAFYMALESKGVVQIELCWGACNRGTVQNLVFIGDEQDIVARLSGVKDPVIRHMPTPATVMVKMVVLRLGKLHDAIEQENKSIVSANQYALNNPNTKTKPKPMFPQIKFSDMADRFKRLPHSWFVKTRIDEFIRVLDRKEITPEILQKAFDIYSVRIVMHS